MSQLQSQLDTRTHVVGELYDTERSYVESLQILVEKYMKPLKSLESNRVLIDSSLVDEIFLTIPEILQHHEKFLSALQDRLSSDWDSSQIIGNVFIEAFTNQQIIDTYSAFINNWKNARHAIKLASQAKPAFERYLEAMSREHRNKLTLDALLIMPVQRIPRYELLIKELIKHTPEQHPDFGPLMEAQSEIHELALKIDRAEKEMMQQEQLKELESLIEGIGELQQAQRDFIRYDLITILGGSATNHHHHKATGLVGIGTSSLTTSVITAASSSSSSSAKKERVLFLFCDLLIMTSVKKKASRRSNLQSAFANSTNDLSLLEGTKFKLLLRAPLDQVEVRLDKHSEHHHALQQQQHLEQQQMQQQQQLRQQQQQLIAVVAEQKRALEQEANILRQIESLSQKLSLLDSNKLSANVAELAHQLEQIRLMNLNQERTSCLAAAELNHSAHHPSVLVGSGGSTLAAYSSQTPDQQQQQHLQHAIQQPQMVQEMLLPAATAAAAASPLISTSTLTSCPTSSHHPNHAPFSGSNFEVGVASVNAQVVGPTTAATGTEQQNLSLEFIISSSSSVTANNNPISSSSFLSQQQQTSTSSQPSPSGFLLTNGSSSSNQANNLTNESLLVQSTLEQLNSQSNNNNNNNMMTTTSDLLVVTFTSIERRQAFLHAFIEAKQHRFHQLQQQQHKQQLQQQQQQQQQNRIYSSSITLRLAQPNGEMSSPERKSTNSPRQLQQQHHHQMNSPKPELQLAGGCVGALVHCSPTAGKQRLQQQQHQLTEEPNTTSNNNNRAASDAQHTLSVQNNQASVVVATPLSGSTIQRSEVGVSASSHNSNPILFHQRHQCLSCMSSQDNRSSQQQQHHHHQLMMHQQPSAASHATGATLHTICCRDQHNDPAHQSSEWAGQHQQQASIETSISDTSNNNQMVCCQQQQQDQLNYCYNQTSSGTEPFCQSAGSTTEVGVGAREQLVPGSVLPLCGCQQQHHHQNSFNDAASILSLQLERMRNWTPRFLITLPVNNFLTTQHPALQFACSLSRLMISSSSSSRSSSIGKQQLHCDVKVRDQNQATKQQPASGDFDERNRAGNFFKQQSVRGSGSEREHGAGQLWLCMSNGFVSHVALVSLQRKRLLPAEERSDCCPTSRVAQEETTSCEKGKRCYRIQPIVQVSGDICKSHINCLAQVRCKIIKPKPIPTTTTIPTSKHAQTEQSSGGQEKEEEEETRGRRKNLQAKQEPESQEAAISNSILLNNSEVNLNLSSNKKQTEIETTVNEVNARASTVSPPVDIVGSIQKQRKLKHQQQQDEIASVSVSQSNKERDEGNKEEEGEEKSPATNTLSLRLSSSAPSKTGIEQNIVVVAARKEGLDVDGGDKKVEAEKRNSKLDHSASASALATLSSQPESQQQQKRQPTSSSTSRLELPSLEEAANSKKSSVFSEQDAAIKPSGSKHNKQQQQQQMEAQSKRLRAFEIVKNEIEGGDQCKHNIRHSQPHLVSVIPPRRQQSVDSCCLLVRESGGGAIKQEQAAHLQAPHNVHSPNPSNQATVGSRRTMTQSFSGGGMLSPHHAHSQTSRHHQLHPHSHSHSHSHSHAHHHHHHHHHHSAHTAQLHQHHHHHHNHHHHQHHDHQHQQHHHHLYGSTRHNTVPLAELRRALERQNRITSSSNTNNNDYFSFHATKPVVEGAGELVAQNMVVSQLVPPTNTPANLSGTCSPAQQERTSNFSLELVDQATRADPPVAQVTTTTTTTITPPEESPAIKSSPLKSFGSSSKSFRSARLLRHPASSLKTSSILAKLVSGASRHSAYLRTRSNSHRSSSQEPPVDRSTNEQPLSSSWDEDVVLAAAMTAAAAAKSNKETTSKVTDSGIPVAAIAAADQDSSPPTHGACFLSTSNCDLNRQAALVSPLSSVSSLNSQTSHNTNSSIYTINSVCASSPNRSTCDLLLAHSASAFCCTPTTNGGGGAPMSHHHLMQPMGQLRLVDRRSMNNNEFNQPPRPSSSHAGCAPNRIRHRSATVPCRAAAGLSCDLPESGSCSPAGSTHKLAIGAACQNAPNGCNLSHQQQYNNNTCSNYKVSEILEPAVELSSSLSNKQLASHSSTGGDHSMTEDMKWQADLEKQREEEEVVSTSQQQMYSSLWLGCDDGTLIVIYCLSYDHDHEGEKSENTMLTEQMNLHHDAEQEQNDDWLQLSSLDSSCENTHAEVKLSTSICDISVWRENLVFVALSDGQLAIFSRCKLDRDKNEHEKQSLAEASQAADTRESQYYNDDENNLIRKTNLIRPQDVWSLSSPRLVKIAADNELNGSSSKLCLIQDSESSSSKREHDVDDESKKHGSMKDEGDDEFIWFSYGKNIYVLRVSTLQLERTICALPTNDCLLLQSHASIEHMCLAEKLGLNWVSFRNSHLLHVYSIREQRLLLELSVAECVNRILSQGTNEIIRQHKTATLKVTALLNYENERDQCSTLFVGTSAGLILHLSLPYQLIGQPGPLATANEQSTSSSQLLIQLLNSCQIHLMSLEHGHSGHVKLLHILQLPELTTNNHAQQEQREASTSNDCPTSTDNREVENVERELFLLSAGAGVDFYGVAANQQQQQQQFSSSSAAAAIDHDDNCASSSLLKNQQNNNDQDNVNHLMIWQL